MKFVKFSIRIFTLAILLTFFAVLFLPESEKEKESVKVKDWYSYTEYDDDSFCKIKMRVYIENGTSKGYVELIPNREITTTLDVYMISYSGNFSSFSEIDIEASYFGTKKVYRVYFDPLQDLGAKIEENNGRRYYIFMNTDAYNFLNNISKDDYQVMN